MEEDNNSTLEEGELSGIGDPYTPLERPANYFTQKPAVVEDPEPEDEVKSSSDTNSDDEMPKRKKIKPVVIPKAGTKKKYQVWCNAAQDDALVENLVKFDVSYVDRSRNVETYNTSRSNKRTHNDRNNKNFLPTKRKDTEDAKVKVVPRYILDLKFGMDASVEEISSDIANKLLEDKEDLIKSVVEVAGKEKAIELFKETQRIEVEGGMMILNNQRRRTPGGVYFYLVKHDATLSHDQQSKIFSEDQQQYKQVLKAKRKQKMQTLKQKIKASAPNPLPELLTRQELELLGKNSNFDMDVKNPPPSPATDGVSNSPDNIEHSRNIVGYDDDFLDVDIALD